MRMTYVGYLGTEETVQWWAKFHFFCAQALLTFSLIQAYSAGALPGEQPAEPRTSVMETFRRPALRAPMLLDAVSGLALVRSRYALIDMLSG